jgi:hypothetical protein
VRTGLILIGLSLAVVGAGVIAAVVIPVPSPPVTETRSASLQNFTSGSWQYDLLHTVSASTASEYLNWSASGGNMSVSLSHAVACGSSLGWCEQGAPLVTWTNNASGTWKGAGPATALYVLAFRSDIPNGSVDFSAEFGETYRTLGPALPLAPFALAVAGGGVLLGIGGLATYLGLFLPSNALAPSGHPGDPELDPRLAGPDADPAAIEEELRFRS